MRVTQKMLSGNMLKNLNNSIYSMERLHQQMSTGKKVSKPSEDPVVAVRSLKFNSELKELAQYKRNLGTAVKWLDTTDSVLQEVNSIFKTLVEKTTQGANGTLDSISREAIAKEISQMKDHLGSIANTNIAGRYIFAGTETDQEPFVTEKVLVATDPTVPIDPANPNTFTEKEVKVFKNTNTSKIAVELGKGIFIDINVNGSDLFGYKEPKTGKIDPTTMDTYPAVYPVGHPDEGAPHPQAGQPIPGTGTIDPNSTKNIFEMLDGLVDALNNPDGKVDEYLDQIQAFEFHFLKVHSSLGANRNRVELIDNRIEDQALTTTAHLSKEEDVNVAEVIMNLNMQESVHRMALGSGARIMQPTLMDFLR